MRHPCQYPVYLRRVGETKKIMLAVFADRTDAVNFAYGKSRGQYNGPRDHLLVLNQDRKIFMKLRQGAQV